MSGMPPRARAAERLRSSALVLGLCLLSALCLCRADEPKTFGGNDSAEARRARGETAFGELTWPLFVHIANRCLLPAALEDEDPDLARCIVLCTGPDDISRRGCMDKLQNSVCGQWLPTCFGKAVDDFESQQPPAADAPPVQLKSLPEYSQVAYHPEQCCNMSFLRVDPASDSAAAEGARVMQLCGFVIYPGLIPAATAVDAGRIINQTLETPSFFRNHYVPGYSADAPTMRLLNRRITKWHSQLESGTSEAADKESNLRAGRFEFILPSTREADEVLLGMHHSPLPDMLSQLWGGDDAALLYAEEVQIQIAIHEYTSKDGATYLHPGTHLGFFVAILKNFFSSGLFIDLVPQQIPGVCLGFSASHVQPGDVTLYFPSLQHGGLPSESQRRRSYIATNVHSKTNEYNTGERDIGTHNQLEQMCPAGQNSLPICATERRLRAMRKRQALLFAEGRHRQGDPVLNQAQNKSMRKEQNMGWVAMLIQKLGFSTEPREEIKDDDVTMAEADDGIGDHRPEMVNEQMSRKEGALAAQVGEDDPDTDQSGGLDCDEIFEYYDTANADFDREACRSDYMTRFDEDLDGQLSPDEFEHLTNALDQEPKEDL